MKLLDLDDAVIFPWDAVSSKVTASEYRRKSKSFLEAAGYVDSRLINHRRGRINLLSEVERAEVEKGMRRFIEDAQKDSKTARNLVIRFIKQESQRVDRGEISGKTIRNVLKPIKSALDLNDVAVSWKKIDRLIPKSNRVSKDREYRLEEIQRLVNLASIHIKVSILIMSSCGMRVGGFDYLRVGDIKPFEQEGVLLCGTMTVYSEEGDDEYETLISKEAYLTFQQYLVMRRAKGEVVTDDSPAVVIRSGRKRCTSYNIRNTIGPLLWKAGIRTERKKRYDVQVDHGFRKFFDNVAKDYVDEAYVEKLIGHDTGTKEHYDRHIPKPALEQYLRAMPYLSVDTVYRVEAELSGKLEEKQGEIDGRITEMRLAALENDKEMKSLRLRLERAEKYIERDMKMKGEL